jgi:4-hydroxythreonine-4-phosphate dehydrogenase
MIESLNKISVGITIGDPSGIGPAITLKAIRKLRGLADFTVIGDNWVLGQVRNASFATLRTLRRGHSSEGEAQLHRSTSVRFIDLHNVSQQNFACGKVKAEYGRASIEYLDKAMELIRKKEIDCLVTAPISKEAVSLAGFKYSGHTEYFSRKAHSKDLVMMLLNDKLKFSLVTRHIPLKSVSSKITQDKLYKTTVITFEALNKLFLIKKPRIIVCGLNPHASDNGLIGEEENRVIKPVIEKINSKIKASIYGPLSSDVAIYKASNDEYDCVIAMYHDQALIPLKLCNKDTGVNLTLGLPFIRTSPLHGTAFDIAKNTALSDPACMIEAIKLAVKCTTNLRKN